MTRNNLIKSYKLVSMSIKESINALYIFDNRLSDKIEGSRTFTIICGAIAWLCMIFVMGYVIVMKAREETVAVILCVCLLCGVVVTLLLRGRLHEQLRQQRRALGKCLHCGYNLIESPIRCPECGTRGNRRHNAGGYRFDALTE